MAFVRQTSFLGGELSPELWGRTDLPRFAVGLRTCRNFFVSQRGMLVSRPGTSFVGYALSVTGRLLPFVVDDTTAYVVEISASGNLALYRNGVRVTRADGSPFVVAHPYGLLTQADLMRLQYAQVGDVMTLTHPSFAPYELKRFANDAGGNPVWTMTPALFANTLTPWWRDTDAAAAVTLGPMLVSSAITITGPFGGIVITPSAGDATHPPREWIWQATAIVQHTASGKTFETLPVTITQSFDGLPGNGSAHADAPTAIPAGNMIAVYADRPAVLRRATTAGLLSAPSDANDYRMLSVNFYRGRGKLFGFVGSTTSRDFIDVGAEPDYTIQPPQGTNPFTILDNAGNVSRTEHPAAVAFFQEKRVFAGTFERGGTVFASATGNYVDFDEHIVQCPGEALLFELAARRREKILSLVSDKRLVALTLSSVWSIGGAGGSPLDFDSVEARLEEEVGTTGLSPLIVDNAILYCRAKGVGVRALGFNGVSGVYRGRDITEAAHHLFLGQANGLPASMGGPSVQKSIVDWTFAEDPWSLVWAVRSDGGLLSLTYSDGGTAAWARHETSGYFRSICCVPEADEDGVYALVTRAIGGSTGVTCVERLNSRHRRGNAYDDGAVDCGIRYEATFVAGTSIGGLGHLAGLDVYVVAVGNPPQGPLTVNSGGSITLTSPIDNNTSATGLAPYTSAVIYIGLAFTADVELLDVANTEARMRNKTLVQMGFEVDQTRGISVGQSLEKLTEWQQRSVSSSYSAPSAATTFVRLPVLGTIDTGARAALRQTLPLPITICGVTREIDVGGSGSG